MIFDALRRRWSDYFGPRATSVSPVFEPKPPLTVSTSFEIDWRIQPIPPGPYTDPHQRGAEPELIGSTHVRIQHRGLEPPGSEMPWLDWHRLALELDAPHGWSACRFPTRRPGALPSEENDICAFVFGITRGDFGIWRSPFPVCITDDDGMLTDQREDVLAAVTHLPTGLGMGVFADRRSAIASCDAADGLGIDWRKLNPNDKPTWVHCFSRLRQARAFVGIVVCRTRHAHQGSPDGPPLSIWEQRAEDVFSGRPEKLS